MPLGEQVGEVLLGRGLARTGDRDDRRATPSTLRRPDLDGRAGRLNAIPLRITLWDKITD